MNRPLLIGIGNRCRYVLGSMLGLPDVQCVAIADVQQSRRDAGKQQVDGHYGTADLPAGLVPALEALHGVDPVHPAVSVDTLNILLADREATKVQLAELSQVYEALRAAHQGVSSFSVQ